MSKIIGGGGGGNQIAQGGGTEINSQNKSIEALKILLKMHSEEEILGLDYGEKRIGVSISRLNKKWQFLIQLFNIEILKWLLIR